jgi:Cu(I)/Ag(I) efflux system membrane protein CusA/SilA
MARPNQGLIARVIGGSARNPVLTILLVGALTIWGWYAMTRGPLDAIPDLSDVQVIVFTEWPGQSPDIVEDQITYPISSSLLAAPGVQFVRGQSVFGLSFVYVIFEDGTDMYWARSRVLEYMNEIQAQLPEGVTPTLGPDATGVGWVFQYALVDETGTLDLQQLRSLQDWNLRYALESVPGVAEVASVGGYVKEYQVHVDPVKLLARDVPLRDVVRAAREANQQVGGRVLEISGHEHMVRGMGYVRSLDDLRNAPVKVGPNGTPVSIGDVAEVTLGSGMGRGIAELDGKGEVVGGIVVMRYGENALNVIRAVKARLEEIQRTLPEGVEIVTAYDRSGLIEASIDTLRHTLLEEMAIVSLVIFAFLLHARSALVPVVTLPVAVLLAFVPMFYQDLTINIMSLGGIAVAIGAMVDASVILIENVHKKLEHAPDHADAKRRRELVIEAMQEVGPSLFFALLVITISFLPVFTLEGVSGRLFRPLAFTKTYSMGLASILAVTLTPAIAALVIRGRLRGEEANPLNRWLVAGYGPVVRFVVRHRRSVIVAGALLTSATAWPFLQLGTEFMPPLNEGALLYMPTAPPGMSVTEASRVLQSMDRQLRSFPEVARVFGKIGRAESATDPAPIGMVETVVVLEPREQWRPGLTWDGLIAEMDRKLAYPGMPNVWWMPIQTRTEMLSTGIRSQLGIKVFGDDPGEIERTAVAIERAVKAVAGTRSAYAERSTGGFFADFSVDRREAARYGLSVAELNDVILAGVGGVEVSETVEGRERYAISVRYAREFRDNPEALKRVIVSTPAGPQVPLSQLASLSFSTGPEMIRSEDGRLVGFVFVDVVGRPIAEFVADARRAVAESVTLAPGTRLEWAGQFRYLERAKERLLVAVPVTVLLVMLLLYLNTGSLVETLIVLLAVPFSLIGAVWLLYALDYNLSVAVWVGLIALAGLDAETGVVMLLYLKLAHARWAGEGRLRTAADLEQVIVEGAAQRIRPKLMTVLSTFMGLVPIMWSAGTGSDVMKRIAAPMVGGLATSFLLELLIYPAIFAVWKGREVEAVNGPAEVDRSG